MYHLEVTFLYPETLCWAGFSAQPSGAAQILKTPYIFSYKMYKGPENHTNFIVDSAYSNED